MEPELDEDEAQRNMVRNSRVSLTLNNGGNINNLYSPSLTSFAPPAVRPRTIEEQLRRETQSMLFTPEPTARTTKLNLTATPPKTSFPEPLDKQRNSMYDRVATLLGKRDKWHGDKKHDKDVDVYSFVSGVEHTMNMWMASEPRGRLDLVIDCTAGPAQRWLLTRKADCDRMMAGGIKQENADWDVIKEQFILQMGGGAHTQRLYQTKLESLTIGKGDSEAVAEFITKFTELAMRAYPLDKHPDTVMRGLMLGKEFGQRVAASDMYVWQEAMRSKPPPETLWDWERALTSAWATEQTIREQRRKQGTYRGPKVDVPSVQRVNNMEAGGEPGEDRQEETHDGRDEGAALNVVAAKKTGTKASDKPNKAPRNKHINGEMFDKLKKSNRCYRCYKQGHIGKDCTNPANRAPTADELN